MTKTKRYYIYLVHISLKLFMKYFILLAVSLSLFSSCKKDPSPGSAVTPTTQYFPPVGTTDWAITTPESLGWNTANLGALYSFLDSQQTRAFLVLKNGKIVVEKYFGQNIQARAQVPLQKQVPGIGPRQVKR